MPRLQISLLGPCRMSLNGCAVLEDAPAKLLALVGYLVATDRERHDRRALAGLLWPEVPEQNALNNLRQMLFTARRAHAEAIDLMLVVEPATLAWSGHPDVYCDVVAFLGPPASDTTSALADQVALFQGPLLQNVAPRCGEAFEEWLTLTRARLEQHASGLFANLCKRYLREGNAPAALTEARRWLQTDPLQEAAYAHAVRALLTMDRPAEAMATLEQARTTLEAELGVGLNRELTALLQEMGASRQTYASSGTLPALPAPRTPFIGREHEIATLNRLVTDPDTRFVSVVGIGGSGKTRLALRVAHTIRAQHQDRFPDGAAFVSLVAADSIAQIIQEIESSTGQNAFGTGDPVLRLQRALKPRRMLLVLDNVEHLTALAGDLLKFLDALPQVTVLATSRVPLNVYGESLFVIGGLVDRAGSNPYADAIVLFRDRARRLDSRFDDTPNADVVIERICRRLSGMPLALELAAAWVNSSDLETIATSLEQNAEDVLEQHVPVDAARSSMMSALASAWQHLSPNEQQVLARLSIFRDSFTLAAASDITGATHHQLSALCRRALLHFGAWHKPKGRYELLELLRLDGAARLNSEARVALECAHAQWYLALAERESVHLGQVETQIEQANLRAELNNIRSAWEYAVRHQDVLWLAESARGVATIFGHWGYAEEGERMFACAIEAIERCPDPVESAGQRARDTLRLRRAQLLRYGGRNREAREMMELALDASTQIDDLTRVEGSLTLARVNLDLSRNQAAGECAEFALRQARALLHNSQPIDGAAKLRNARLRAMEIQALNRMGTTAYQVLEIDKACGYFEEAIQLGQSNEHRYDQADALRGLGRAYAELGLANEAVPLLTKALATFVAVDDHVSELRTRMHSIVACFARFAFGDAGTHLHKSRQLHAVISQPLMAAYVEALQAEYFCRSHKPDEALQASENAQSLYQQAGYIKGIGDMLFWSSLAHLHKGNLDTAFKIAARCATVSAGVQQDQTVANANVVRGRVLLALQKFAAAKTAYLDALQTMMRLQLHGHTADAQAGLAEVALEQGDTHTALAAVEQVLSAYPQSRISMDPIWQQHTCVRVLRAVKDDRADRVQARLRENIRNGLSSLPMPEDREVFAHAPIVASILSGQPA